MQNAIMATMADAIGCVDLEVVTESSLTTYYSKVWKYDNAAVKRELEELIHNDILKMDAVTRKVSQGPRFHTSMQSVLVKDDIPLLEVAYRIKGVSFTQSEIDQLRYELIPATNANAIHQPSSLVQRSYTIKGVNFTQSEIARLFSLLSVTGMAAQSGNGQEGPHYHPFFDVNQRR
jgi:hypothetical protein